MPEWLSDRSCPGAVTVKDDNTYELAKETQEALSLIEASPYVVLNKMSRKKIDLNRSLEDSNCGDRSTEEYWDLFHKKVLEYRQEIEALFGKGLVLDLHGHGHSIQRIELGYLLSKSNEHLNILGATSGETGSAAIAGIRGRANMDIFIMYPDEKVSPLQELQMTTNLEPNVHCIAIDGSFDDCQNLMKNIFSDLAFKKDFRLGAINSVNWARIMAQIVYYAYASLRVGGQPSFAVPTGNFGNVFAAYIAHKMGFPIGKLVVATNENDILHRFFDSGDYSRGTIHFTATPAMDIQVASLSLIHISEPTRPY